jgi:hypothetical protein
MRTNIDLPECCWKKLLAFLQEAFVGRVVYVSQRKSHQRGREFSSFLDPKDREQTRSHRMGVMRTHQELLRVNRVVSTRGDLRSPSCLLVVSCQRTI